MRALGTTLASSVAIAAMMSAAPAYAQDNQAEEETQEEARAQGNEIVVTALRREESLQDTPAAITAFNPEAITNAGIERPGDFISLTSNVNLVETQNAGNAFVIIRGLIQRDQGVAPVVQRLGHPGRQAAQAAFGHRQDQH